MLAQHPTSITSVALNTALSLRHSLCAKLCLDSTQNCCSITSASHHRDGEQHLPLEPQLLANSTTEPTQRCMRPYGDSAKGDGHEARLRRPNPHTVQIPDPPQQQRTSILECKQCIMSGHSGRVTRQPINCCAGNNHPPLSHGDIHSTASGASSAQWTGACSVIFAWKHHFGSMGADFKATTTAQVSRGRAQRPCTSTQNESRGISDAQRWTLY